MMIRHKSILSDKYPGEHVYRYEAEIADDFAKDQIDDHGFSPDQKKRIKAPWYGWDRVRIIALCFEEMGEHKKALEWCGFLPAYCADIAGRIHYTGGKEVPSDWEKAVKTYLDNQSDCRYVNLLEGLKPIANPESKAEALSDKNQIESTFMACTHLHWRSLITEGEAITWLNTLIDKIADPVIKRAYNYGKVTHLSRHSQTFEAKLHYSEEACQLSKSYNEKTQLAAQAKRRELLMNEAKKYKKDKKHYQSAVTYYAEAIQLGEPFNLENYQLANGGMHDLKEHELEKLAEKNDPLVWQRLAEINTSKKPFVAIKFSILFMLYIILDPSQSSRYAQLISDRMGFLLGMKTHKGKKDDQERLREIANSFYSFFSSAGTLAFKQLKNTLPEPLPRMEAILFAFLLPKYKSISGLSVEQLTRIREALFGNVMMSVDESHLPKRITSWFDSAIAPISEKKDHALTQIELLPARMMQPTAPLLPQEAICVSSSSSSSSAPLFSPNVPLPVRMMNSSAPPEQDQEESKLEKKTLSPPSSISPQGGIVNPSAPSLLELKDTSEEKSAELIASSSSSFVEIPPPSSLPPPEIAPQPDLPPPSYDESTIIMTTDPEREAAALLRTVGVFRQTASSSTMPSNAKQKNSVPTRVCLRYT